MLGYHSRGEGVKVGGEVAEKPVLVRLALQSEVAQEVSYQSRLVAKIIGNNSEIYSYTCANLFFADLLHE